MRGKEDKTGGGGSRRKMQEGMREIRGIEEI